jgi:hypothetical protein
MKLHCKKNRLRFEIVHRHSIPRRPHKGTRAPIFVLGFSRQSLLRSIYGCTHLVLLLVAIMRTALGAVWVTGVVQCRSKEEAVLLMEWFLHTYLMSSKPWLASHIKR